MSQNHLDRNELARRYASRHLKTDPGTRTVYYLPTGAPEREIRLLEINDLIVGQDQYPLEPIDFGVENGGPPKQTLMVLDVTPAQWERISRRELALPEGWSLEGAVPFAR